MNVINNIFDIGDIVYLKTDRNQSPQIVVAIIVYKSGELMYKMASSETGYSDRYEFELSKEKTIF